MSVCPTASVHHAPLDGVIGEFGIGLHVHLLRSRMGSDLFLSRMGHWSRMGSDLRNGQIPSRFWIKSGAIHCLEARFRGENCWFKRAHLRVNS